MPSTAGAVPSSADAVVIGSGPNGLVCANLLADAGWDVVVLEAAATPGGGVSSADYLGPGYVADVCSAFYPLAAASPVITGLHLEDHGLRWRHAPAVLAHSLPDGRAAVLHRDLEKTVDNLDGFGAGDGRAWRRLFAAWQDLRADAISALFTPFPPLRAGLRAARQLGPAGVLRLARYAALPVRRLGREEFSGPGGPLLLAGCALHTDLTPESAASSAFGWLLCMLGQDVGFPVPEGGAGSLSAALVRRLESRGGRIFCSRRVERIDVAGGRAAGVITSDGDRVAARRAVMADVVATQLFGGLVGWDNLPSSMRRDIERFDWDNSTFKVDWALGAPVPWRAEGARGAGTVHLSDSLDEITQYSAELHQGLVPARPFVLVGQMTTADPTRSPAGTEVVWAYTHVPRRVSGDAGGAGITGRWDHSEMEAMAARLEDRIEAHAPGFKELVVSRHVMGPAQLEAHDTNLVAGAINGGTSAIHQELVFRPVPGLGRPETPVRALYLASSSAHPGGGVHGACGSNAARAALWAERPFGRYVGAPLLSAAGRMARGY